MNRPPSRFSLPSIVLLPILLSLFFWSYLGLTSQTLIYHDSLSYQQGGMTFFKGPWSEYFTSGPNREPLYPLFISLAMHISKIFNCDYLNIQIIFQIALMTLTQWMTALLLKRMQISNGITALAIAYLGISPAFINFGLILYSEIITYPLILWLVMQLSQSLTELKTASTQRQITNGVLLAIVALSITFTKAIFEIIAPILLVLCVISFYFKRPDILLRKRIGLLMVVFMFTFQIPLIAYKQLNKIYNGNYALTNRGTYALYGHTARRMLPLDKTRIKAALANIPGADVCQHFYQENCEAWGFLPADILASVKFKEVGKTVQDPKKFDQTIFKDSLQLIFNNPIQYIFLTSIEGAKIFFWESPQIYCVVYPQMITALHDHPWVRYSLRLLTGLGCLLALIWAVIFIFKNRAFTYSSQKNTEEKLTLTISIILLILLYTFFHAIFFITARYAIPIAPLFIILIAQAIDFIFKNNHLIERKS